MLTCTFDVYHMQISRFSHHGAPLIILYIMCYEIAIRFEPILSIYNVCSFIVLGLQILSMQFLVL